MAAVFGQIPLPQNGMDAFQSGLSSSQGIFDSMMKNKLYGAQAKHQETMANLPFGGATVPGPAGQIVGLEMVRQQYGENSPQYKAAMGAFNMSQNSEQSRINYQTGLTNSLPLRYTTSEGKQLLEQSNVNQGRSPTGTPIGEAPAPGQAPYQPPENNGGVTPSEHYGLRQAKQDLPTFVMQRNLFANNIDKTLENIDVDALTAFNNPMGSFQLKEEQAKDALKLPTSDKYKKYIEAEKKFNFLGNQVRQFYGDSIQPNAMDALQKKLDPRSPWMSANIGKKGFASTKDLLKKELQTYRDASKDASVYTGQTPKGSSLPSVPYTGEGSNPGDPLSGAMVVPDVGTAYDPTEIVSVKDNHTGHVTKMTRAEYNKLAENP